MVFWQTATATVVGGSTIDVYCLACESIGRLVAGWCVHIVFIPFYLLFWVNEPFLCVCVCVEWNMHIFGFSFFVLFC